MTSAKLLPKVVDARPILGCDPEFFFKTSEGIIGAEKIIPKNGLIISSSNKIIIDGVQAELNPTASTCRQSVQYAISACFLELRQELKKYNGTITADFSQAVEISKENLMDLEEKSRQFGCAPSNSIYKKAGIKIAAIDPTKYFGVIDADFDRALRKDYKRTVELLDLICGNTCVLVDRNPSNIERRKVYGRAGEFRLPAHGLEYRTLSNFWLTSYPLMSLAFGMGRLATQLMADNKNHELFYDAFTSKVKAKNVQDAINNNDFDMAMDNFNRIKDLLTEVIKMPIPESQKDNPSYLGNSSYPLDAVNMPEFMYFVEKIVESGLQHWFPKDPMTLWCEGDNTMRSGFNEYLKFTVKEARILEEKTKQLEEAKKDYESRGLKVVYADPKAPKKSTLKKIKKVA